MSIQTEIDRLNSSKVDIVQASVNFGLEVPEGSKIDVYAAKILELSQSPIGGAKYVKTFSAVTSLSIPAAEHGCGETPWADIYFLSGSDYIKTYSYPSEGYKVTISATGDITINFSASSTGRVVIG